MPPIGETLKEARVRQRIDIAQVETATKIRAKYLRALESDDFDQLPGSTFVRTFIRTYADYLGLDSQLLVEAYRLTHEPPVNGEAHQLAPPPPSTARRRRGDGGYRGGSQRRGGGPPRRSRTATIVAIVVGIVLLFLVIGLLAGGEEQADQAGAPAAPEVGDDTAAEGGSKRDRGGGGKQAAGRQDVRLRVTPAEATFVCIDDADGKQLFEGVLESPRTFRGETLLVNLGRSSARLDVNGERVEVPQTTQAVGLELTPNGDKELAVDERPCT